MWVIVLVLLIHGLGVGLVTLSFWKMSRQEVAGMRKAIEEEEGAIHERKETLKKGSEINAFLEKRISELTELYELTKKISMHLEFQDVFTTLCDILNTHFTFERGFLLLMEEEKNPNLLPRVEQIYALKGPPSQEAVIPYLSEMIEEATRKKETFEGRGLPFTAFPLRVRDALTAILVCEKLKSEDLEKFTILSRQLALALQKVRLYETLQELAITDGLTHLYSRRYFLERFHEELERSKRHTLHLSFLMADIDHFKQKNDQYGHLVGDVILKEVAMLLKANVREIDLVGRYGGEEFSIALPDTAMTEALVVAERIRSAVEQHTFTAYDEVAHVTLSLGVGAYPEDGENPVDLIEAADGALYRAKQMGRNKVCSATITGKV